MLGRFLGHSKIQESPCFQWQQVDINKDHVGLNYTKKIKGGEVSEINLWNEKPL